ncbi:MAG: DegV family protein [Anaerolineales bacterium]
MLTIVTDSTSDLPTDLAARHAIYIVPTLLIVGEKAYEDGRGFTREEFYTRLPTMTPPPTTAAPSSGTFAQVYADLFARGATSILSIHAASQLTAIYNAARLAAEPYGNQIHILDSGSLSMGLGFQVLAAAEAAAQGASLAEVTHLVEAIRPRIRLIAMLDSLEYLRRSGRVSNLRALLGDVLRLRLFVDVRDGQVLPLERIRTRSKAIEHLGELLDSFGPVEQFAMLHTNAEADARAFLAQKRLHTDFLVNVTPVIGTHVGPNGLGFAALLKG